MKKNSLYIIDGHAQIYAAFYAPMSGNLVSPDGEPTKATLIFTTMLLKLIREREPAGLVVAMDSSGPTFRHKMYDDYKANRPPMPEDLRPQIERIEQIVKAFNIPILRKGGFEADDIIGTITDAATEKDLEVFICSKDKDLEQLLNDHTFMYDPKSGVLTDVAGLLEKKGITPEQVIDALALEGDTSDNIPGIPDVGPKTALQWIQKYGNLDNLLAHKDEIKGKRGNNLRDNLEQLELSRKLVTINRAVPLELDWDAFKLKPINGQAVQEVFEQLGFRKLLQQLDDLPTKLRDPSAPASLAPKPVEKQYTLIDTETSLAEFAKKLRQQKVFALDTETTGLNPIAADLVGLSFSWQPGRAYYLPVKAPMGQKHLNVQAVAAELKPILADGQVKKVGQNIKYDMVVLRKAGMELAGVDFDTMVASYLLDSGRQYHNLDSLARDHLGVETIKLEEVIGKGRNQLTFDLVDTMQATDYAAEDADVTWQLYEALRERFKDEQLAKLFADVEIPLVDVLAEMEFNGVALDVGLLKTISGTLAERMEELVDEIHEQAGCTFNVDSPKQLAEVLFDRLGLEATKKTKSGKSTDQEVLENLRGEHPVADLMLEYRQLSKLKNTYVDKLPAMICSGTQRVHASFNQTVTATGRLSSSNPNMQNMPIRSEQGQEIRRAIVPQNKDDLILAADYSQIELRFLAHFSEDPALKEAFTSGQDIHRFVAAQVFGVNMDEVTSNQRAKAKGVNFGIIYGQTPYGLSRSLGIAVSEAQEFIDEYYDRYKRIKQFMDDVLARAKKDSFVRTILGRKRPITDLNDRNYNRRKLAERMAVNTVVQGSAADMIKLAMVNLYRRIRKEQLRLKMIMQVHDELVFEVPQDQSEQLAEIVRQEMAQAMELHVPVVVDIGMGHNWLECK